jgi:CRISPR-associated protein Cas1
MLKGRLGLETAKIPQADRHGLLWLSRGNLMVEDGTLHFISAGDGELPSGDFCIPFQMLNCILLGPGGTVSHDALRLMARHGTGLVAIGEGGVRYYASMPFGPNDSALARQQVKKWADPEERIEVARKMYDLRMGGAHPSRDINVLRGIEGAHMKESYKRVAQQFGVAWSGRVYDRKNPDSADEANAAINHVVTAVEASAQVAVAVVGALPQLGFIHEDAAISFCLDVTDLYRDTVTLPIAFAAVQASIKQPQVPLERIARKLAGRHLREKKIIPDMIDKIKLLLAPELTTKKEEEAA